MNKESVLENISIYSGGDSTMTNELIDLIKTAVNEAAIELASFNVANNQAAIAALAHKLRISMSLIGEETVLNQAILLDESVAMHTELTLVESTFTAFKISLNEIKTIMKDLP